MKTLRHVIFVGIALALPHIVLFWSVLFQNRVFADGDAIQQMYPAAYALKTALEQSQSFAWNQHILTGFPMAASFVGGFFSPLYQFLFRTFPPITVYHLLTVLYFVLSALFTYILCRRLKLTSAASLLAGISFPLGTAYWLFSSNLTVTSGFPLIPGLLLTTLLLHQLTKTSLRLLISLMSGSFLGLLMLQAHPQWPMMAMMMAGMFSLYLDWMYNISTAFALKITNHKLQITNKLQIQNLKSQTTPTRFKVINFGVWCLELFWSLVLGIWCFIKALISSLRTTYWLLLSLFIGIIISLPQLLASTRIGNFSARGAGIALSSATVGSLLPTDLFSLMLPNLNVPFLMQKPYLLYMGALPLLLAVLSLVLPKLKHYRFFFWVCITCILIAMKYSPLFWAIHQLPLLNAFREPSRFMYIGLFALTMLSAYGFEALLSQPHSLEPNVRRITQWLVRISATLAIGSAIATFMMKLFGSIVLNAVKTYFDANIYSSTTKLPVEHYHAVIDQLFQQIVNSVTLLNVQTAIGIVSLLVGSLLISWYVKKQNKNGPIIASTAETTLFRERNEIAAIATHPRNDKTTIIFSFVILLLTLINLIGVKIGTLHTISYRTFETPPASASILQDQNNTMPFRVFAFLPGSSVYQTLDAPYGYDPEQNIELLKNLLSPNMNILYSIDSLDYYDDLMDRRNARLLSYLGSNRGTYGESLADMDVPFEEKTKLFLERLPLLSMTNVKYITSLYPLDHSRLKLISELRVTSYELREYIYENLDVVPRYYLANDVEITPALSEKDGWENLIKHKITENTKSQKTLIECDSCYTNETPPLTSPPYQGGDKEGVQAAVPTTQTNTTYTFNIETDAHQWFIFGQNNLPGWTATIDGASVEIHRANYLFQAIRVPPGKHVIEWKYKL